MHIAFVRIHSICFSFLFSHVFISKTGSHFWETSFSCFRLKMRQSNRVRRILRNMNISNKYPVALCKLAPTGWDQSGFTGCIFRIGCTHVSSDEQPKLFDHHKTLISTQPTNLTDWKFPIQTIRQRYRILIRLTVHFARWRFRSAD